MKVRKHGKHNHIALASLATLFYFKYLFSEHVDFVHSPPGLLTSSPKCSSLPTLCKWMLASRTQNHASSGRPRCCSSRSSCPLWMSPHFPVQCLCCLAKLPVSFPKYTKSSGRSEVIMIFFYVPLVLSKSVTGTQYLLFNWIKMINITSMKNTNYLKVSFAFHSYYKIYILHCSMRVVYHTPVWLEMLFSCFY